MGWRREEMWLEVDVAWFGEGAAAPALAGIALPPLPRFPEPGLAASRLRREAWKRRRRARATALLVLPAVLIPAGLARGGGIAGSRVVAQDPPSLTLRARLRRSRRPRGEAGAAPEPAPKIEYRNATSSACRGAAAWSTAPGFLSRARTGSPGTRSPTPCRTPRPAVRERAHDPRDRLRARRVPRRAPAGAEGSRRRHQLPHGGRMDAHVSHQNGLDVDMYYPRLDRSLREPRLPRRSTAGCRRISSTASSPPARTWSSSATDRAARAVEGRHPVPAAREPHARPLPAAGRVASPCGRARPHAPGAEPRDARAPAAPRAKAALRDGADRAAGRDAGAVAVGAVRRDLDAHDELPPRGARARARARRRGEGDGVPADAAPRHARDYGLMRAPR